MADSVNPEEQLSMDIKAEEGVGGLQVIYGFKICGRFDGGLQRRASDVHNRFEIGPWMLELWFGETGLNGFLEGNFMDEVGL